MSVQLVIFSWPFGNHFISIFAYVFSFMNLNNFRFYKKKYIRKYKHKTVTKIKLYSLFIYYFYFKIFFFFHLTTCIKLIYIHAIIMYRIYIF